MTSTVHPVKEQRMGTSIYLQTSPSLVMELRPSGRLEWRIRRMNKYIFKFGNPVEEPTVVCLSMCMTMLMVVP